MRNLHLLFGYALLFGFTVRLIWGVIGSHHAKFASFIPTPKASVKYLWLLISGKEPRYIGHNPAGAVMIVSLIACILCISITGWMMGLDKYWGEEWVENLHLIFVNVTLVLVFLHICGVIYSSLKHRENLVIAMITGWKKER